MAFSEGATLGSKRDDDSYTHELHRSPEDDHIGLSPLDELAAAHDVNKGILEDESSVFSSTSLPATSIASGKEVPSVAFKKLIESSEFAKSYKSAESDPKETLYAPDVAYHERALADAMTTVRTSSSNSQFSRSDDIPSWSEMSLGSSMSGRSGKSGKSGTLHNSKEASDVSVVSVSVMPTLSTIIMIRGEVDSVHETYVESDAVKVLEHAGPTCEEVADAPTRVLPSTTDAPRSRKLSFVSKLKLSKVFGGKISKAKNDVNSTEPPPLVIVDLLCESGEVELTNKSDLVVNNAVVCLADHAADDILNTDMVMMDRKQSKCSYGTDDTISSSSYIADTSYLSMVERLPSSPDEELFTGGLMGKLLACSAIPFRCNDVEEPQTVATVASKQPATVALEDCVDETLNVEAYKDYDSKLTRIGFLDEETTVESSPIQNVSKEEGMQVTSRVILKTRMMPGFEVDDIARKLVRHRLRAESKVMKKSQMIKRVKEQEQN
jgi:hypothetical protein